MPACLLLVFQNLEKLLADPDNKRRSSNLMLFPLLRIFCVLTRCGALIFYSLSLQNLHQHGCYSQRFL
jgi:hypothetical protein